MLAAAALAALASVVLAWRGLRGEAVPGRRVALVALRSVAALAALFLLAEPALRVVQTTRVRNRLAVLVDRSRSMNFPVEPGGETRVQAAARFVAASRPGLEALADEATVEGWGFSRDAWPVDLAALSRPDPATGGATDALGALRAAAGGSGAPGRRLAGVLLVTDGADNGALAAGLSGQPRADLLALGVPVNVVAVGSDAPRDLAVERVAVDDFAFVRSTLTVEATLRARGFGREDVQVLLKREGQVVAQATLKLEPGKETYTVPLSFAPDTTGTFVLTVSTPVLPGEAVVENNTRSFVLRVIRDRVRVLLVAGRPSWDERFLRGLLKQDPNVDLVSFFILRTAGDNPGPQDQLSLIPFPVAEIFGEQLRTFDAVIFLDFAYQPYRSLDIERFLPNLRDYVRGGGAFAMVGGGQSFAQGHYAGTPIADILAVDPAEGMGETSEPFRPRLTAEGRRHPVTSLAPGEGANEAAWTALPPLPGLNFTRPLPSTDGARVLLEAPTLLSGGRPAPVVAVREVGVGTFTFRHDRRDLVLGLRGRGRRTGRSSAPALLERRTALAGPRPFPHAPADPAGQAGRGARRAGRFLGGGPGARLRPGPWDRGDRRAGRRGRPRDRPRRGPRRQRRLGPPGVPRPSARRLQAPGLGRGGGRARGARGRGGGGTRERRGGLRCGAPARAAARDRRGDRRDVHPPPAIAAAGAAAPGAGGGRGGTEAGRAALGPLVVPGHPGRRPGRRVAPAPPLRALVAGLGR